MSKPFLTVQEFFGGIFIDSYVFAMPEGGGQTKGSMPTNYCYSSDAINKFFEETYFPLNKNRYGIHFTPNGIKNLEEKNRKHNLSHINAWFLDIDIEGSKHIKDEADKMYREDRKGDIQSTIFGLDLMPSLTVETRNGYHLYWFALPVASEYKFQTIQSKLAYIFKEHGSDLSMLNPLHSLRVPYFRYYKDGEEGTVTPIEIFSSLKLYSEKEMLAWLEPYPEMTTPRKRLDNRCGPTLPDNMIYAINVYHNQRHGIFSRAEERPVRSILEKLSGSEAVRGDVFSFVKTGEGKYNVMANLKVTPNWIDEKENRIFSNNQPRFCVIHHFLAWYGYDNKQIAQIYHSLGI